MPPSDPQKAEAQVLRVSGLSKVFGSGERAVTALDDITFAVQKGELMALLGPSGSGKSTLLMCVSLILEPTGGTIELGGRTVYDQGWSNLDLRRFRRQNIGFVFQGHNLIPFLTSWENTVLALELNRVPRKEAGKRADELLAYLEVDHRADALPANLSGGEQQRVALARALANRPPIILADEPTASLDTERGFRVMALLKQIARDHRSAVITVTHDERMIEGFDTIRRLKDGRMTTDPAGEPGGQVASGGAPG